MSGLSQKLLNHTKTIVPRYKDAKKLKDYTKVWEVTLTSCLNLTYVTSSFKCTFLLSLVLFARTKYLMSYKFLHMYKGFKIRVEMILKSHFWQCWPCHYSFSSVRLAEDKLKYASQQVLGSKSRIVTLILIPCKKWYHRTWQHVIASDLHQVQKKRLLKTPDFLCVIGETLLQFRGDCPCLYSLQTEGSYI